MDINPCPTESDNVAHLKIAKIQIRSRSNRSCPEVIKLFICSTQLSMKFILAHKWASMRENLSSGFAYNKGADQPALPRRLIIAFVIPFLESIIFKRATGKISIIQLVSVAEETGLSLALSETPKTSFVATRPKY